MAAADVQDIGPGGQMPDDLITQEYQDIKRGIEALIPICAFWEATLAAPAWQQFVDKMNDERFTLEDATPFFGNHEPERPGALWRPTAPGLARVARRSRGL